MSAAVAPHDVEAPKTRRSSWFGTGSKPSHDVSAFLSVPLTAFPAEARPLLAKFDGDGNGNIDIKELEVAARLYEESQQKVQRLGRMLVVGSLLLCATLAAMGGLTFVVVDRLKDSSVSTDGLLTTKDGSNTLTVKSVPATETRPLSSWDPDDVLQGIRYIDTYSVGIGSDGLTNGEWTSINLPVQGYTRRVYRPSSESAMYSVVTFLVPNGAVILNGTDMIFEADGAIGLQSSYISAVTSVFPVVMHSGTGRRLQPQQGAPRSAPGGVNVVSQGNGVPAGKQQGSFVPGSSSPSQGGGALAGPTGSAAACSSVSCAPPSPCGKEAAAPAPCSADGIYQQFGSFCYPRCESDWLPSCGERNVYDGRAVVIPGNVKGAVADRFKCLTSGATVKSGETDLYCCRPAAGAPLGYVVDRSWDICPDYQRTVGAAVITAGVASCPAGQTVWRGRFCCSGSTSPVPVCPKDTTEEGDAYDTATQSKCTTASKGQVVSGKCCVPVTAGAPAGKDPATINRPGVPAGPSAPNGGNAGNGGNGGSRPK